MLVNCKQLMATRLHSLAEYYFPIMIKTVDVILNNTPCHAFSTKVCNDTANATYIECWAPAFKEEMPEEKSDIGEICIHMDGRRKLWEKRFDYHHDANIIPIENDDHELPIKQGETEVSLHVCLLFQ